MTAIDNPVRQKLKMAKEHKQSRQKQLRPIRYGSRWCPQVRKEMKEPGQNVIELGPEQSTTMFY